MKQSLMTPEELDKSLARGKKYFSLLKCERSKNAVRVLARFAEGKATKGELAAVVDPAHEAYSDCAKAAAFNNNVNYNEIDAAYLIYNAVNYMAHNADKDRPAFMRHSRALIQEMEAAR